MRRFQCVFASPGLKEAIFEQGNLIHVFVYIRRKDFTMKIVSVTGKAVIATLVSLSMVGSLAFADPSEGKGKPYKAEKKAAKKVKKDKKGKKGTDADTGSLVMAGITVAQARRLALDYRYTGYKSLPPGIQKNLARGKPLPPGIAKKVVPSGMLSHLPRHRGYEWRVAGTDLILVAIATNVVADVLSGVFR